MIKYSYAMAEPAKDKSKIGKNIKINLKKVLTLFFLMVYLTSSSSGTA